jgi:hypothetical protein
MLVEQAALSFELWTARPAPREVMYNAVGGEKAPGEQALRDWGTRAPD